MKKVGNIIYRKTQNPYWAKEGRVVPVSKDRTMYRAKVLSAKDDGCWIVCRCKVLEIVSISTNLNTLTTAKADKTE